MLSQEVIHRAVYENYECVYVIDLETWAFQSIYESDSFSSLLLERSGDNFSDSLNKNLARTVYYEDQDFVREKLQKDRLLRELENQQYVSFVYRLVINGTPLYHKLRALKEDVNGCPCVLAGIRNVDTAFRQDKAQTEALSAMHKKEKNHLEAILASAAGYMEANLIKDLVLEISQDMLSDQMGINLSGPIMQSPVFYGELENWIAEHVVIENREKYRKISSREYLIRCFQHRERRASVSFSLKRSNGQLQPCKKVFYLYQDDATNDILSFCVIYDLTEQQRQEKERADLENELQLSRIRNFTSQMQPHFLYNALGSIQEIVLVDPEYASELIGDFTVHLRSCIRAMSNDAPIPFQQELANIKAYINIEKMRLGSKLNVVYDISTMDFCILPLSIQPLVENAIRHGVYERGTAGGTVTLRTAEREGAWEVSVEDSGVGFNVQAYQHEMLRGKKDSTGLENIMFRLDKVMHASVDIVSKVGTGTIVKVTIPKGDKK